MKTVAHYSQEITTTTRELASGRYEISCVHVSGQSKTGFAGSTHAQIKAEVLQAALLTRLINLDSD